LKFFKNFYVCSGISGADVIIGTSYALEDFALMTESMEQLMLLVVYQVP